MVRELADVRARARRGRARPRRVRGARLRHRRGRAGARSRRRPTVGSPASRSGSARSRRGSARRASGSRTCSCDPSSVASASGARCSTSCARARPVASSGPSSTGTNPRTRSTAASAPHRRTSGPPGAGRRTAVIARCASTPIPIVAEVRVQEATLGVELGAQPPEVVPVLVVRRELGRARGVDLAPVRPAAVRAEHRLAVLEQRRVRLRRVLVHGDRHRRAAVVGRQPDVVARDRPVLDRPLQLRDGGRGSARGCRRSTRARTRPATRTPSR